MTLEDLFKLLSYGELSTLATAVDVTGTIKKEHQNRIVAFANEGLRQLHSRFRLQELTEEITVSTDDVAHAFPETALKIQSIYNSYGVSLSFGSTPVEGTIYVSNRTLYLPACEAGEDPVTLRVTYYKRHTVLSPITSPTDLTQEITLQPELHEALTAYIAQKVFGSMVSQDAQAAAMMYKSRYEQVCLEASNQGNTPGELEQGYKFEGRGFV